MSAANEETTPKRPRIRKTTVVKSVSMPVQLAADIDERAKAAGMTFSAYMLLGVEASRDELRAIARQSTTSGDGSKAVDAFNEAISTLSAAMNVVHVDRNNLNQIARKLNSGAEVSLVKVNKALDEYEAAVRSLTAEVGGVGRRFRSREMSMRRIAARAGMRRDNAVEKA